MNVLVGPRSRWSASDRWTSRRPTESGDPLTPRTFSGRELTDAEVREGYRQIADRFDKLAEAATAVKHGLLGVKPSPVLGPALPSAATIGGVATAVQVASSAAADQMRAEAARDFGVERFERDLRDRIDRDKRSGHREGRERAERIERAEKISNVS